MHSDLLPRLVLQGVLRHPEDESTDLVRLATPQGAVIGRYHPGEGSRAVLWVFGSGGGLGGPAGGLYTRLSQALQPEGVASLELDYRRPGELRSSVLDVLLGLDWLLSQGKDRVAMVGHSFGGAVVIRAGTLSASVCAVAALSSQATGTADVDRLSPKPLLLVHGEADEVLPSACSQDIYERAGPPKDLILYPGARHGLDGCREALDRDLLRWLRAVLGTTE